MIDAVQNGAHAMGYSTVAYLNCFDIGEYVKNLFAVCYLRSSQSRGLDIKVEQSKYLTLSKTDEPS